MLVKKLLLSEEHINRVATRSGKTKKNDRSQEKMGVFEKKSGNLIKLKKKSDLGSLNLQIPYFPKPSNGKR